MKGKIGDGPVMGQVSWFNIRFFEGLCNCCHFESGLYSSRGEGGVDYFCDHGEKDGGQALTR